MPSTTPDNQVHWFRNSSPYINAHRGRTFVVMLSGELLDGPRLPTLIHDLALLNSLGIIGMGTTVLAGWVFDATQSYGAFLLGTSAFSAAAAITVFTFLHKPVRKAQVEAVTS